MYTLYNSKNSLARRGRLTASYPTAGERMKYHTKISAKVVIKMGRVTRRLLISVLLSGIVRTLALQVHSVIENNYDKLTGFGLILVRVL